MQLVFYATFGLSELWALAGN